MKAFICKHFLYIYFSTSETHLWAWKKKHTAVCCFAHSSGQMPSSSPKGCSIPRDAIIISQGMPSSSPKGCTVPRDAIIISQGMHCPEGCHYHLPRDALSRGMPLSSPKGCTVPRDAIIISQGMHCPEGCHYHLPRDALSRGMPLSSPEGCTVPRDALSQGMPSSPEGWDLQAAAGRVHGLARRYLCSATHSSSRGYSRWSHCKLFSVLLQPQCLVTVTGGLKTSIFS